MPVSLEKYADILQEKNIYKNRGNFIFYASQLFKGIDFKNKTVLEIGAGKGVFSCYFALCGARKVVALEPESDGSNPQMLNVFNKLIKDSDAVEQVELKPVTFQEYNAAGEYFDIIVSHNSINHLDEKACTLLLSDIAAKETYLQLFDRMNKLLVEGGQLLIADCARFNFWGSLGIKTPVTRAIDWTKHQQPEMWSKLLEKSGFSTVYIKWNTLNGLRLLGRFLFGNRIAAYFINSHFSMLLKK